MRKFLVENCSSEGAECEFTNDIEVNLLAQQVTNSVVEVLSEYTVDQEVDQSAKSKSDQENEGALSALGKLLNSPIFFIIGIVLILGLVAYFMFKKGGGKKMAKRGVKPRAPNAYAAAQMDYLPLPMAPPPPAYGPPPPAYGPPTV